MTLDQKALEAARTQLETDFQCSVPIHAAERAITTYLAAFPASDHAGMVERLRARRTVNFAWPDEALAALDAEHKLALEAATALSSGVRVSEAVAWRCEDLILPNVSVIDDWEHAQARMRQPKAWKVTPLYAAPSLSDAPVVTDAMVERACMANINPLSEPSETERKHMRKALTAALGGGE